MQRAMTVTEFCAAYRVGRTKAYEIIGNGQLQAVKLDGKTLIRTEDAEAWLSSLPPLKTRADAASASKVAS